MANTALLLMDLQRRIVGNVTDDGYLPRVGRAATAARQAGLAVLHVVVGPRGGQGRPSARNTMFGAIPDGAFDDPDGAMAIHDDVTVEQAEPIITKRRVSAFSGSDLDLVLRSADVDHLVLAGVATSGVVLSTVRQASDLDYRLTVLSDGCWDSDPEVHQVLTGKLFPRQAEVVTVDGWVG